MDELELSYADPDVQVDYVTAHFGSQSSDEYLHQRVDGEKFLFDYVDPKRKGRIAEHVLQARNGMKYCGDPQLDKKLQDAVGPTRFDYKTNQPSPLPELPTTMVDHNIDQQKLCDRFALFSRLNDSHLAAALVGQQFDDMNPELIEALSGERVNSGEISIDLDLESEVAITAIWNARRSEETRTSRDRLEGLPHDCDSIATPFLHRYRGIFPVQFRR